MAERRGVLLLIRAKIGHLAHEIIRHVADAPSFCLE
jgi:hypothetical protein